MLLIPNDLTRTEQPQDGSRFDPAHPLAARFHTVYMPAVSAANLGIGGAGGLASHAAPDVALPASMRAASIVVTNQQLTASRSYGPTPAYPITMIWVGQQGSNANTILANLAASGAISGSYWYVGGGSSTIVVMAARNAFGTALSLTATVPGGSALGTELVIVAQSLSASDHRLCVNGSAVATSSTNIGSMVAWDRVAIGQPSSANNQSTALLAVASGGAGLTDEQMQQLSRDPRAVYALFEPQRIAVSVSATGGSQAVAIGQSSEANTAQAFTARVSAIVPVGQASETDAAQAIGASQKKAVGQAAEADTAQAFYAAQRKAIGQGSEVDSAQPIAAAHLKAIGQATEADAAQAVAYSAPGAIGQASESDVAQPIAAKQSRAIGQASETDAAQPITVSTGTAVAIGMALEIDTAGAFVAPLLVAIGQALEVDAARAMTSIGGDVSIDPATIRRVARSPALARLARSPAMVRSTNGL